MNTRLPITWQRKQFECLMRISVLPPGTKVQPVVDKGIRGRWVWTGEVLQNRAILYFHGGAYTIGSSYTHRSMAAHLAWAGGVKVWIIDYRLAPEHPYPAALQDGLAAYRALLDKGYAPNRLVMAGDSAGGGLVMATLVTLRDAGLPLPAAGICFSPWVDLECSGDAYTSKRHADPFLTPNWLRLMGRHYVGGHDLRRPTISPVHADMHGLPPLLIQVGSDEILLSDAHRLADRARADGVQVNLNVLDTMCHYWTLYAGVIPPARQAVKVAGRFIAEHAKIK
jgi:acetyl esterase/lipase